MVVLALDTTSRTGSVAVLRADTVLAERTGDADVPHGRRLPGDVLAALAAAEVPLASVELFAVASGPGAFTGLRIGIATIQGLAFAHGRPVAAVSALEAGAHAALAHPRVAIGTLVAVWMDAARGEVFSALYEVTAGVSVALPSSGGDAVLEVEDGQPRASRLAEIDGPSVATPDATLSAWRARIDRRPVIFIGEGAATYSEHIAAARGDEALIVVTPPLASTLGRLAIECARAGQVGPPHAVRPLYVRRPDAEIAREQRAVAGPVRSDER